MNEEGMRAGFALHGDKGTVRFEVRGYEFPNPEEDPHSEWFDGVFSAEIGPWSGSFRGTVLASDLRRLAEELEGALAQPGFKASFDPIEPHLVFEIEDHAGKRGATEGQVPGKVEIDGRLDHEPILGTALCFVLESDRERLEETARGIREVLTRFPDRHPEAP